MNSVALPSGANGVETVQFGDPVPPEKYTVVLRCSITHFSSERS